MEWSMRERNGRVSGRSGRKWNGDKGVGVRERVGTMCIHGRGVQAAGGSIEEREAW
jgi:hypothetical protein